MPQMNGTGPEGKGSRTGRGMGRCRKNPGNEDITRPGKGQGRRNKFSGGQGKENRMQRGLRK